MPAHAALPLIIMFIRGIIDFRCWPATRTGSGTRPGHRWRLCCCRIFGRLGGGVAWWGWRSEEHTSELQSPCNLVYRLLLGKKDRRDRSARKCQAEDGGPGGLGGGRWG